MKREPIVSNTRMKKHNAYLHAGVISVQTACSVYYARALKRQEEYPSYMLTWTRQVQTQHQVSLPSVLPAQCCRCKDILILRYADITHVTKYKIKSTHASLRFYNEWNSTRALRQTKINSLAGTINAQNYRLHVSLLRDMYGRPTLCICAAALIAGFTVTTLTHPLRPRPRNTEPLCNTYLFGRTNAHFQLATVCW